MKTGFIGLGQQGKYLAINLVAAGHDLMVYDIRREPLEEPRPCRRDRRRLAARDRPPCRSDCYLRLG